MSLPKIANPESCSGAGWQPLSFNEIEGWPEDDHLAAFNCLKRYTLVLENGEIVTRPGQKPDETLQRLFSEIANNSISCSTNREARSFFEEHFLPFEKPESKGFVTGYFEPEVRAAKVRSDNYPVPLYTRPDDLIEITDENRPEGWSSEMIFGRYASEGIVEFFNRREIESGALSGRGLELFWLSSFAEAFFIHVQGSARLVFEDGTTARVAYSGKSGHAYTSIGAFLVERGVVSAEMASMQILRDWIEDNPQAGIDLMRENDSFIFFSEVTGLDPELGPLAGAGVQLEARRSLAVDKNIHAYGTPVWISTNKPLANDTEPFEQLMIAQDTGSAIVGPQRGDLFMGSGLEAGNIAGNIRHDCRFIVLQAREV